jgi:hypothetical protein
MKTCFHFSSSRILDFSAVLFQSLSDEKKKVKPKSNSVLLFYILYSRWERLLPARNSQATTLATQPKSSPNRNVFGFTQRANAGRDTAPARKLPITTACEACRSAKLSLSRNVFGFAPKGQMPAVILRRQENFQ